MMFLIQKYPYDTMFLVVLLIVFLVLIFNNRWDALKKAALYAVTVAEDRWGDKTGDIKYAEVVLFLKNNFKILTLLFTDKQLDTIIIKALTQMKEILKQKEQSLLEQKE